MLVKIITRWLRTISYHVIRGNDYPGKKSEIQSISEKPAEIFMDRDSWQVAGWIPGKK
ncbi:hypothetical protein MuYL_2435 [Mucilaginibacter xinganensis]|uniref:Uncharacterized protein n=1 Tax=Mucilaginibacter xinganensis TaxID=1234841 RepID=A0A223NWT1_9SPHI|nr:hypothetical protein MuYL_2435 [Mucilaginibacter xinganensis]